MSRARASRNVAVTPSARAAVSRIPNGCTAHSTPVNVATTRLWKAPRANRKYSPAVEYPPRPLRGPAHRAVPHGRIDDPSHAPHQVGIAGSDVCRVLFLDGELRRQANRCLSLRLLTSVQVPAAGSPPREGRRCERDRRRRSGSRRCSRGQDDDHGQEQAVHRAEPSRLHDRPSWATGV